MKEEISAIHNLIITRGQSVSALAPLIRLVKGNNESAAPPLIPSFSTIALCYRSSSSFTPVTVRVC